MFGTSFDTSSDKFQNYYKDLSLLLKRREIDLVIVVNMFLTGFDATTFNTLWVDKNLRAHGLIQAYSRTNRILNSVKTFGNIVSFRDLEEETNDAIALFGAILRLRNILQSFDDFVGNEILPPRAMQDYQSVYLNLYQEFRSQRDAEKESINDYVVFEIELIKQVEINVDYILMLVERFRDAKGDGDDKEIRAAIERAVDSSPSLRNKKDLIEEFVESLSATSEVDVEWAASIAAKRAEELDRISRTKAWTVRRRTPSSRPRSVTAPFSRPARLSPRSSRRCPASRKPVDIQRKSAPCSSSSASSSTASLA
jgi:type I restriction enzyme R subunit